MTFPTETDLRFYESKRTPRWAQAMIAARSKKLAYLEESMPALIDSVVNAHAGLLRTTSGECAAYNLIAIVRMRASTRRRQGRVVDLGSFLEQLAQKPGCMINPEKRAAFAKKWARRMQGRAA